MGGQKHQLKAVRDLVDAILACDACHSLAPFRVNDLKIERPKPTAPAAQGLGARVPWGLSDTKNARGKVEDANYASRRLQGPACDTGVVNINTL